MTNVIFISGKTGYKGHNCNPEEALDDLKAKRLIKPIKI